MSRILYKTELTLILIFSVFALISAFFIEYVLGHEPCNLCLLQRLPYLGVILAFFINIFIDKFERKFFYRYIILFNFINFIYLSCWYRTRDNTRVICM